MLMMCTAKNYEKSNDLRVLTAFFKDELHLEF